MSNILQQLYDSEINFSISTFWDAGFDWKLGDEMNGWLDGGQCDSLETAAIALSIAAKKYFPSSVFVKERWPTGTLRVGDRVQFSHEDASRGTIIWVEPGRARVKWDTGGNNIYEIDLLKKVEE